MFEISRYQNRWLMRLKDMEYQWSKDRTNLLAEELKQHLGVRRTSYDTWEWVNRIELERFITYWHLKYVSSPSNL
jgi:hypothetical protein